MDRPRAWHSTFFNETTSFPDFLEFLGEGLWDSEIVFSGKDEVDMLGSGDA